MAGFIKIFLDHDTEIRLKHAAERLDTSIGVLAEAAVSEAALDWARKTRTLDITTQSGKASADKQG